MTVTEKYVLFWGDEPFTNFTRCEIEWEGQVFSSSEQAFMWAKARYFKDESSMEAIMKARYPREAKSLGRHVRGFKTKEWSAVSFDIMESIVRAKFDQHKKYREELLKYSGCEFVEASPFDKIWGIGCGEVDAAWQISHNRIFWPGENRLGKILTKLRDEYAGN